MRIYRPPDRDLTKDKIINAMEEQERKAWKALAGYKFYMFGYHAAVWVNLNKLLEKPLANPFSNLVIVARGGAVGKRDGPKVWPVGT